MAARPKVLDMMCGGGGASMGYHMAGFEVTGVDVVNQPEYPFRFIQRDALELDPAHIRKHFDVVHASPPCQEYSTLWALSDDTEDLVEPTRELLLATGLPYVIENVPGAPLNFPVTLCGSSFGLRVRRHRLFECNWPASGLPCEHDWQDRDRCYRTVRYHNGEPRETWSGVVGVYGGGQGLGAGEAVLWRVAMGIDWLSQRGLAQAVPPAYTRHLGRQLAPLL